MTLSVSRNAQLALGLELLLQGLKSRRGRALVCGRGPAVSLCGQDREVRGGRGQGSSGQALLGHLCLAGIAPMTRWCPCYRAVVRCPHWWWRRGSSRSPAVRPPLPLGLVAHRDLEGSPLLFPKPTASLFRWCYRTQWDHLRDPPGSPSIPIPSCGQHANFPMQRCAATSLLANLSCQGIRPRPGGTGSPAPLLPVAPQTPILWIPPTLRRRSPPCSGWRRSCHPVSECRGGLSASSWSTCSRLPSAMGSAEPWRASSSTGGWARVVVGPALGGPQILPRITIRVSLPDPPHTLSPGRGSKEAAAGTRGPNVGTLGLPQNRPRL